MDAMDAFMLGMRHWVKAKAELDCMILAFAQEEADLNLPPARADDSRKALARKAVTQLIRTMEEEVL